MYPPSPPRHNSYSANLLERVSGLQRIEETTIDCGVIVLWGHMVGETWYGKHGDTTLSYVRSRFPDPRIEIESARTAREIGSVSLFRVKSFEISADNHPCWHLHHGARTRIRPRERSSDSRSVELAMRFTTASL